MTDNHGADDTATVRISAGNFPPDVFIDSPFQGKLFKVGEQMTLVGSAEDPEDGPLPNGSLIWRVEKHHDTHFHPFLPETAGNNIPIVGPEPEDLSAATNSYLEIILTATDSQGLSTTVTRNIQPKKVNISFDTIAAGLTVEVAGSTLTAPATVTSWQDWGLIVNAPDQADAQGRWWVFDGWSDLGARTHTIQTPGTPAHLHRHLQAASLSQTGRSDAAPGAARARVPALRRAQQPARGAAGLAVLHAGGARVAAAHDVQHRPRQRAGRGWT